MVEMLLRDHVALITGAGGGIGGAVARRFATAGARLVLADLRLEPLEALASSLPAGERLIWDGDLTCESAVGELFRRIEERFGRLDVAVNTAGILRITPFSEIRKSEWDLVMNVNAGSAFLVCQACCEPMRRRGY